MQFTKAKAIAAAVGTFAVLVSTVFADNVLDTGEVGELVTGAIVAAIAVYAVYKTPNKIVPATNTQGTPTV
jgi:hypothetical protein